MGNMIRDGTSSLKACPSLLGKSSADSQRHAHETYCFTARKDVLCSRTSLSSNCRQEDG